MPRIIRSKQAREDLIDIGVYIAGDSLSAALRVLDDIEKRCQMLARMPLMGRLRVELGPNLRSFPVRKYVIFYRPLSDGIEVVRVLHGARDLESFF